MSCHSIKKHFPINGTKQLGIVTPSITHDNSFSHAQIHQKVTKVRKRHKTHNNDTHSSWNHGVLRPPLDRDVSALLAMPASDEDEVTASTKAKQTVNTSCSHSEQMENIRTSSTPPRPGQIFPNHISSSGIAGTSHLHHPAYLDADAHRPPHPPPTLLCPTGCRGPPASNAKTKQPRTGKTRHKKTNPTIQ